MRPGNLYLTGTPGDSDVGRWQPGVQKHHYQAVTAMRQCHSFLCKPCTLLLTQSKAAWCHFFFSSKRFSNLSFGRFSPSRGLEFEVSLCYCRRAPKKSSLWFKCTTPRCSARWCTCIFSSLIRGLSAFFDMDPYKNNFVPDNALTDEDRIQQ